MFSLYRLLLTQHDKQLRPRRYSDQIVAEIQRRLEDAVLVDNMATLVIECLPRVLRRSPRDIARVNDLGRSALYSFFFVSKDDALNGAPIYSHTENHGPVLIKQEGQDAGLDHCVLISGARFTALLVSTPSRSGDEVKDSVNEVIWTFDPDVVFSALEYLMARVRAEHPSEADLFTEAVNSCSPRDPSAQFTLSFITEFAHMMEEQAAREIAINRIATAIRSSLELPNVLQTTVDEVGQALEAQCSALNIDGEEGQPSITTCYIRDGDSDGAAYDDLLTDLEAIRARMHGQVKTFVHDGAASIVDDKWLPAAAVSLIYHERTMGMLMVRSDDPHRVWQDSEILLLRTVADQVAVAVNHARLFQLMQEQALTDDLTSCFNRRFFNVQLERDLHLSVKLRQPVSLILLDIDHFKHINDTYGHDAGDAVLSVLGRVLREEVRGVDTAARYGGEEFAIILPQAGPEGALAIAEKLRVKVESLMVSDVGRITISLGVATFPLDGTSPELLIKAADSALYQAKKSGRNRVCSKELKSCLD
jgi:diguanylate cyclase (GGDEF)-like protein